MNKEAPGYISISPINREVSDPKDSNKYDRDFSQKEEGYSEEDDYNDEEYSDYGSDYSED
jgi:hypothetical protein